MSYATNRLEEAGFSIISGGKFITNDGKESRIYISQRLRKRFAVGRRYAVAVSGDGVRWAIALTEDNKESISKMFSRSPFQRWTQMNCPYDGGVLQNISGKELLPEGEGDLSEEPAENSSWDIWK